MVFLDRNQMIPSNDRSLVWFPECPYQENVTFYFFLWHILIYPAFSHYKVISGGVAANKFITKALKIVCDAHGYHLSVPPPYLCNDNGVMIAWNGVERYRENSGVLQWDQLDSVQVSTRSVSVLSYFGKNEIT